MAIADLFYRLMEMPASGRRLTNARPIDVAIVDGSGNHVTSFGGTGGSSSNFDATFPDAGTAAGFKSASGSLMKPGTLDAGGNLLVNVAAGGAAGQSPASPTVSTVASDGSNHTAFSTDATRLGGLLHNRTDVTFLVKFGATASQSSLSTVLLPGERKTLFELVGSNYQGQVDAISESADAATNHALYVTSFAA